MKHILCTVLLMAAVTLQAETVQKISVDLSIDELQALIKVLDEVVQERAPRLDAPTADSPSYPVVSGDAAELALIASALCSLRSLLAATLGNVNSPGSCFPTIATIPEIDNATLNVIAWLKTLMRELRGVCT